MDLGHDATNMARRPGLYQYVDESRQLLVTRVPKKLVRASAAAGASVAQTLAEYHRDIVDSLYRVHVRVVWATRLRLRQRLRVRGAIHFRTFDRGDMNHERLAFHVTAVDRHSGRIHHVAGRPGF